MICFGSFSMRLSTSHNLSHGFGELTLTDLGYFVMFF